jgi:hypothetical protein
MLARKPEGISVTGEGDTKVWKADIKAIKADVAFASETGGPTNDDSGKGQPDGHLYGPRPNLCTSELVQRTLVS